MRHRKFRFCFVTSLSLSLLFAAVSLSRAAEGDVLICKKMHAKAMPKDFSVAAMKFTGPSGDGRRGSAGFVVAADKLIDGDGTRLTFTFHRDPSGFHFQAIHPFKKWHVLISLHSGLTIHRGGSWGDVGWGHPTNGDKVTLSKDAADILPLKASVEYKVISQLSKKGVYTLSVDGKLVCRHTIKKADPLVLEFPEKGSIWLGSSFDRTGFAGENFKAKLQPGHTGLIIGPMDGSAPQQNFQEVTLSAAK